VQLVAENEYSKCTVCGTTKTQAIYRFRHQQYVPQHLPKLMYPVCRKCVYKEVYGSKNFRKNMKERMLDGNEK
jgi:hypothetical protein